MRYAIVQIFERLPSRNYRRNSACVFAAMMSKKCQNALIAAAYEVSAPRLRSWLVWRLGDIQAAEDVTQSAFLAMWRRAQLSTVENPNALLFKIGRDLANNEFKRRARHAESFSAGEPAPSQEPHDNVGVRDDPEVAIETRQELEAIFSDIERLPDNQRTAFQLSRFGGKNYSEIAEILNVSVSSVEKYMMKSLRTLRDARDERQNGHQE